MAIRRTRVVVTGAAGGAGVATANASTPGKITGRILAIHLTYTDAPPAGTTDVTIAEANNSPAMAVLTVSNAATDGWFFPMAQAVNAANTAITGQGAPIYVDDVIKVTIAQANDNDGVVATILWEECLP